MTDYSTLRGWLLLLHGLALAFFALVAIVRARSLGVAMRWPVAGRYLVAAFLGANALIIIEVAMARYFQPFGYTSTVNDLNSVLLLVGVVAVDAWTTWRYARKGLRWPEEA